jgi:hypothetical protein
MKKKKDRLTFILIRVLLLLILLTAAVLVLPNPKIIGYVISSELTPQENISAVSCTENWQCSEFGVCANSLQTRICTDINSCGTAISKPNEQQSCNSPAPAPALIPANFPVLPVLLGVIVAAIIIIVLVIILQKKPSKKTVLPSAIQPSPQPPAPPSPSQTSQPPKIPEQLAKEFEDGIRERIDDEMSSEEILKDALSKGWNADYAKEVITKVTVEKTMELLYKNNKT